MTLIKAAKMTKKKGEKTWKYIMNLKGEWLLQISQTLQG